MRPWNRAYQQDSQSEDAYSTRAEWRSRPYNPLGRMGAVLYRLLSGTGELVPHQPRYDSTNHQLLHPSFLGVNTDVQPFESAESAELGHMNARGFVFHELGILQHVEFDTTGEMPSTYEEVREKIFEEWQLMGFCVVARLDTSGRLDRVCIVYNIASSAGRSPTAEECSRGRKATKSRVLD